MSISEEPDAGKPHGRWLVTGVPTVEIAPVVYMTKKTISISYDEILDTALKGVRRTAAFLGLGINAASDPDFKNYSLTDIAQIQLLPNALDNEAIEDIKTHFATWIVGCGLRELIETYGVFLDQVCQASLHIAVSKKELDPNAATKLYKRFSQVGVGGKQEMLTDTFGINSKHPKYVESINRARNCLTHRTGIVAQRDINDESILSLRWLGADILAIGKSGKTATIEFPLQEPFYCEEETTIALKFVERTLSFGLGKVIVIPPRSLAEICFFMNMEAKDVKRSAVEYAKRKGVTLV